MLNHITVEKVEEVIRLVETAERTPGEAAADPRRGGPLGDRATARPETPLDPQPASDWRTALERYLADLSDAALAELIGLYRFGHGDAADSGEAVQGARREKTSHPMKSEYLLSRGDLAGCLRRALERT